MLHSVQDLLSRIELRKVAFVMGAFIVLFFTQTASYAQDYVGSFEFDGYTREYEVYLPQNIQANMPLVLSLHGIWNTIGWYKTYTLMHEVADTMGFVIVYPEGIPTPTTGCSWNSGLVDPSKWFPDTDDVSFLSALIDTMKSKWDIDLSRVYCCGFSLGGQMSFRMAGECGYRFAAVAAVCSPLFGLADTWHLVRPMPVLHMAGTADPMLPWEGFGDKWSMEELIEYWVEKNQCTLPADTVSLPDIVPSDNCTVEKISYRNCSGESEVIHYKIIGGGHNWPSSAFPNPFGGNRNMDINANLEILNFFKNYSIQIFNVLNMEILTPSTGDQVSGQTTISWSFEDQPESHAITISWSNNAGRTWQKLWTVQSGDNTYLWDTQLVPDGTKYMLRLVAVGDSTYAWTQSAGTFTVNNPGPALPEIELIDPQNGEVISGEFDITWNAADADGDPLLISLDASSDDGSSWMSVVSDEQNDGSYTWDTREGPNSPFYRIRLRCTDGIFEVADTSGIFTVENDRTVIPPQQFSHVEGRSNAIISVHITDSDQLTGDLYRITFNDTLFEYTVYDVLNIDTGEKVLENATQLDGFTEGPLFEGMRLLIQDYEQLDINYERTGWSIGSSTLTISISLPEIPCEGETIEALPYFADYRITFFDHIVDTSSSVCGASEVEMMFTVWNLTDDIRTDVIFVDMDDNQTISRNDILVILFPDGDEPQLSWELDFLGPPTAIDPQPGDEYVLTTSRPLTGEDVYEFRASTAVPIPGDANEDNAVNVLDVISVVNYILGYPPDPFNMTSADCDGNGTVNVLDALGIVNVILGIGECTPGECRVVLTHETMDFLTSLKSYFSEQDYARFMILVKAAHIPIKCHLAQNYPNPFNPETKIEYTLPYTSKVKLSIFNVLGQEVKVLVNGQRESGYHTVTFDAGNLASGIYFYQIEMGDFVDNKKMILLK